MGNNMDAWKKLFGDARQRLKDLKRFEEHDAKFDDRMPGENYHQWLGRQLKMKRVRLLKRLIPTCRCPTCGEIKLKPRSWVILTAELVKKLEACSCTDHIALKTFIARGAVCRGCYVKYFAVKRTFKRDAND